MSQAIVNAINELTRNLHTSETEKTWWQNNFSKDWVSWAMIYIILWAISLLAVIVYDRSTYIASRVALELGFTLFWVVIAIWHANSCKRKLAKERIKKHLILYQLFVNLFNACGELDKGDDHKRDQVTEDNLLAICQIVDRYRSKDSKRNKSGMTLEHMLRTAHEQKWSHIDRFEYLFLIIKQKHLDNFMKDKNLSLHR